MTTYDGRRQIKDSPYQLIDANERERRNTNAWTAHQQVKKHIANSWSQQRIRRSQEED